AQRDVPRDGIQGRLPAEGEDRRRRRRRAGGGGGGGRAEVGEDRQVRRRQGVRHFARPGRTHPHRRAGRAGALGQSIFSYREGADMEVSWSEKVARFKVRLKDAEWRQYGALLLTGKLV